MASDIVERLRETAENCKWCGRDPKGYIRPSGVIELEAEVTEAAAEIERLRSELSRVRSEALEEAAREVEGGSWSREYLRSSMGLMAYIASAIRALKEQGGKDV